ncbi:MAG: BTAD domain-containing putative transcriptional regulator, partial [Chloroflexota bacterium]
MLSIKTLGEVGFVLDGEPVAPLRSKTAAALLIYLASHERPFSREYLAELFWADRTPAQSSANLRSVLRILRPIFADFLTIDRQSLAFNHAAPFELDAFFFAETLEQLMTDLKPPLLEDEAQQLNDLLSLYQGSFLEGLYIDNAPEFEAWQRERQARYQDLAENGFRQLVAYYLASGQYQAGINEANRLLTFDPYDETIQRDLMALYWRSGHRNGALRQYATFKKLLQKELEIEPTSETSALFQRIREAPAAAPHNLPAETTVFVGREEKLIELETTLARPQCHLLTVVGQGGVGKTRLLHALGRRALAKYPGQFSDGVYFLGLSQLSSGLFLATTIAEQLGLTLSSDNPLNEIQNYLRDKEMLLLLDNFEQLLEADESADPALHIVGEIIRSAPAVKIVVSSRVRLRLNEEWVVSLTGLSTPPLSWGSQLAESEAALSLFEAAAAVESFESVALFVQAARRIDRGFAVTVGNLAAIGAICRLLEGHPLGIELAAAWVRGMSPAEIIAKLDTGFDFLRSPVRNRPERHQTLRNLFDHTWRMLDPVEDGLMQRLSVFRGPFTAEAAEAVAGADVMLLLDLVDKSLIQVVEREEVHRYGMHELLRRYAAERLATLPQSEVETKTAHSVYFAKFIEMRSEPMKRGAPKPLLAEIGAHIDELRAALGWSLETGRDELLDPALEGLFYFFWTRGWLQEGATTDARSRESLQKRREATPQLLARVECWEAEFYVWLGRYDDAKMIYLRLIPEARESHFLSELNFALHGLG